MVPDVEVTDPQLLVDECDKLLDLGAARLRHLQIERRRDVQRLKVLHPVERHVVVAPLTAHRDRDFVGVLAFEVPVVDGGDVLDNVDGVDSTIEFKFEKGHDYFPLWSVRGQALRPRIYAEL